MLRLLILGLLLGLFNPLPAASRLEKKAKKAQAEGRYADAYLLTAKAIAKNPENLRLWSWHTALRRRGLETLNIAGLEAQGGDAPAEIPKAASISPEEYFETRLLRPPPALAGSEKVVDLDFTGDSKTVAEKVLGSYGLKVVFESDYQSIPNVRFRLDRANWRDAIHALESATGAMVIPVSDTMAMIAKDTVQKRTELEPTMAVVVPFPEPMTPQDLQEAARAVQSIFDITKMGVDTVRRQVLFRDRVSRIVPALRLMEQLMTYRSQIVLRVDLISVAKKWEARYGLRLPSQVDLITLGGFPFTYVPVFPPGYSGWASFGGGLGQMAIGISDAAAFAVASRSAGSLVTSTEIRTLDGQPGTIHVGDKYPILTQGYYGGPAENLPPTDGAISVYKPPPTVSFEDLGVVLKATPRVHGLDAVSLELDAEYRVLTGQTLNDIPVISNRKFTMRVRLNFGESAVITGFIGSLSTFSRSGIPGLINIPALRENSKSKDENQVLMVVTPYLVSLPPTETATPLIWAGTETRPLTPLQ